MHGARPITELSQHTVWMKAHGSVAGPFISVQNSLYSVEE
jgi:hypothetical protein